MGKISTKKLTKITKRIGLIFFFIFLLILFTGRKPISSLIVPSTVSKYETILDDAGVEPVGKNILGIGDTVELKLPSEHKSIDGMYELKNVVFKPSDSSLAPWKGEEKPREWSGEIGTKMKKFDIEIKIPIPNNVDLVGKTIQGKLYFELIYPKMTKPPTQKIIRRIGEYANYSKEFEKPMSIHVFTSSEVKQLSGMFNRILTIWILAVFFFFVSALLLLTISYGIEGEKAPIGCFLPILAFVTALISAYVSNRFIPIEIFSIFTFIISYFMWRIILAEVLVFIFNIDLRYNFLKRVK